MIEALLSRVNLINLIENTVPGFVWAKHSGNNAFACCPFHREKTASFSVSTSQTGETQLYYCFGCQRGGNAINFLIEYQGLSYREAVTKLADLVGFDLNSLSSGSAQKNYNLQKKLQTDLYACLQTAAQYYQQQLTKSPLAPKALNYLSKRGLKQNIIQQYKLGFAPANSQELLTVLQKQHGYSFSNLQQAGLVKKYAYFRDRLMFPIYNKLGTVVGFGGRSLNSDPQFGPKYLNSPETKVFNKSKLLYGLYEALAIHKPLTEIVIVEGYMDVLSIAAHTENKIATVASLGTAFGLEQLNILYRLPKLEQITFCFDGDTAGQRATWRLIEILLANLQPKIKLKFCLLPDEHDPDSYLVAHGQQNFRQLLNYALSLSDYLLQKLQTEYDLEVLEGKWAFVERVKEYLQHCSADIFNALVLKKVSKITFSTRF